MEKIGRKVLSKCGRFGEVIPQCERLGEKCFVNVQHYERNAPKMLEIEQQNVPYIDAEDWGTSSIPRMSFVFPASVKSAGGFSHSSGMIYLLLNILFVTSLVWKFGLVLGVVNFDFVHLFMAHEVNRRMSVLIFIDTINVEAWENFVVLNNPAPTIYECRLQNNVCRIFPTRYLPGYLVKK